jgi:hypothetical protein
MWKWLKRVLESPPFKFPSPPPADKLKRIGVCGEDGAVRWFVPERKTDDM